MQKVTDKKKLMRTIIIGFQAEKCIYMPVPALSFFAGVDMSNVGFNQESVNLGMICARHTNNRQCFKKVTCPFN